MGTDKHARADGGLASVDGPAPVPGLLQNTPVLPRIKTPVSSANTIPKKDVKDRSLQ